MGGPVGWEKGGRLEEKREGVKSNAQGLRIGVRFVGNPWG